MGLAAAGAVILCQAGVVVIPPRSMAARVKLRRPKCLTPHVHERHEDDEGVGGQVDVAEERLAIAVPSLTLGSRPIVHYTTPAFDGTLAEDLAHKWYPWRL